jgi:hypothetical protein
MPSRFSSSVVTTRRWFPTRIVRTGKVPSWASLNAVVRPILSHAPASPMDMVGGKSVASRKVGVREFARASEGCAWRSSGHSGIVG